MGNEWKGCYLKIISPTMPEMKAFSDDKSDPHTSLLTFVADRFVAGKAFDGEKVVDIKTKEEVKELPQDAIYATSRKITKGLLPND